VNNAPIPNDPPNDDDNAPAPNARGEIEMGLAAELVGTFVKRYRFVHLIEEGQHVLYRVDPHSREISVANVDTLQSEMRHYLGRRATLKEANAAATRAMDMMRNEAEHRILERQVAPLLLEDAEPGRWCYRRLPITGEPPLHIPPAAYQEILDRVEGEDGDDGKAKAASQRAMSLWIGSLLDPASDRSQYLFLYGEGGNGKSSLAQVLLSVLGRAAISLRASTFTSKFGKAPCANKRLVIFDDNKNASFMASGDFREATGSDTLAVERKGKDVINVRNDLKFLITSNRLPELDGDHADMRRNIFVKLGKYTGPVTGGVEGFRRALLEQGPDILRYCYTLYREHKERTSSSIIPVTQESHDKVHELSMEGYAQEYFEEYFSERADGKLRKQELLACFQAHRPPTQQHERAVQRYFNSKFRVSRGKDNTEPRHYVGVERCGIVKVSA
jgi:hypothetical protein